MCLEVCFLHTCSHIFHAQTVLCSRPTLQTCRKRAIVPHDGLCLNCSPSVADVQPGREFGGRPAIATDILYPLSHTYHPSAHYQAPIYPTYPTPWNVQDNVPHHAMPAHVPHHPQHFPGLAYYSGYGYFPIDFTCSCAQAPSHNSSTGGPQVADANSQTHSQTPLSEARAQDPQPPSPAQAPAPQAPTNQAPTTQGPAPQAEAQKASPTAQASVSQPNSLEFYMSQFAAHPDARDESKNRPDWLSDKFKIISAYSIPVTEEELLTTEYKIFSNQQGVDVGLPPAQQGSGKQAQSDACLLSFTAQDAIQLQPAAIRENEPEEADVTARVQ